MLAHRTLQQLDLLFQAFDRNDAPGVVVGVALGGADVYRRALGMASVEHGVALSDASRLRIGSTTKHFCCLGILLLEEQGLLDLEAPVRRYLPELDSPAGEPTLRQLMHHTGGLQDPLFATFLADGGFHTGIPPGATVGLLRRMGHRNFAPGTRMAYSNAGYTLLSRVIERISGQSWNDFMTQRVFTPLRMHDTMLAPSDLDIVPRLATPHLRQADGRWQRGIHPEELLGSGGMISTVDDLLRWAAHMRGPQPSVGRESSWARMLTPQTFAGGATNGYGFGLMLETHRGIRLVHHAGATLGTQSQLLIAPDHALDIVVLTNRMDLAAPLFARKILEAVLEDQGLEPAPVLPAARDHPGLLGRWFSRASRTLVAIDAVRPTPEREEGLQLSVHHAPAGFLLRTDHGLEKPPGPSGPIELRRVPATDARPDTLAVDVCGEAERFERLVEPPPSVDSVASTWCGRYRYTEFGRPVAITRIDDRLVLDLLPTSGQAQWELEPLADDLLGCATLHSNPPFPVPLRGVLTLDRDDQGVRGFWLDTDRSRNLRFDRC